MTKQRIAEIVLYQKHGYHRYFPEWKQKDWRELESIFGNPLWRYDEASLLKIVEGINEQRR